MPDDSEESRPLKTGLEFCGEFLVPGGSNAVKGDWKQAGIHAALGVAARGLFGVPGLLLVSSDSIVKAMTGRHLHEALSAPKRASDPEAPALAPAPAIGTAEAVPVARTPAPVVTQSAVAKSAATKKHRSLPARKSKAS